MKLIIDISKNEYNDIVEQVKKCDYPDMGLGKIIANGKPVSTEGDLISREALKKVICLDEPISIDETWEQLYDAVVKAIDNAQPVEPEITNDDLQAAMTESYHLGYELAETKFKRPHGRWIICNQDNEGIHKIECPFCKYVCGSDFGDQISMTFQKLPNYCENCGADMRKEKEE